MYTPKPGRLALAALTLALLPAPPALASFPDENGRISFARYDDVGFEQIWTANPDLTAAEQLTATPGANNITSAWAPDGSRIAFDSDRSGLGPNGLPMVDIFTMKPDGSDLVQLTHDAGFNGEPSYSPDGGRIAFESDRGALPEQEGIYRMRTDGTDVQPIVLASEIGALFLQAPKYSPDGRTIAFTAVRRPQQFKRDNLAGATGAVYLVNSDGSNLRRLTPWGKKTSVDVDWSPDGSMLAFETEFKPGAGPELYVVRPDGSGLRNLTNNASLTHKTFEASSDPAWAPDGSRILFIQAEIIDDAFGLDLWSIRPDGTDMHPVEHTPVWEDQPAWGSASPR
jgi:Tol biopolymer transport system component